MDTIANEYRGQGRRPSVLYSSVHPLGAVSYVQCAVDIAEQLATRVAEPVHVYVTSMGVTHVATVTRRWLTGLEPMFYSAWVGCSPNLHSRSCHHDPIHDRYAIGTADPGGLPLGHARVARAGCRRGDRLLHA